MNSLKGKETFKVFFKKWIFKAILFFKGKRISNSLFAVKGNAPFKTFLAAFVFLLVLKGWVLFALLKQQEGANCFAEVLPEDMVITAGEIEDQYCRQKVGTLIEEIQKEDENLKQKAKRIEDKEKKFRLYKWEVQEKIEELAEIRVAIQKMYNAVVNTQKKKVEKLVKIYQAMEAENAAKKLDVMEEDLAVWLLQRLNSRQAGQIMDAMPAKKASSLSKKLKPKDPRTLMKEFNSSARDKKKQGDVAARKKSAKPKRNKKRKSSKFAAGKKILQVAAYKDSKWADRTIKKLKAKGYRCFRQKPVALKKPQDYYRVYVGPFPNEKKALQVKAQLEKKEGYKGIFVLPAADKSS